MILILQLKKGREIREGARCDGADLVVCKTTVRVRMMRGAAYRYCSEDKPVNAVEVMVVSELLLRSLGRSEKRKRIAHNV